MRMNRVKNRRVIRRIADKTRKAGKGKSLIAVLAIVLTTVLFTSVFTVGGSMIKKQQESTMRQVGGSAHAGYKYLTQEEYDIVKKDSPSVIQKRDVCRKMRTRLFLAIWY